MRIILLPTFLVLQNAAAATVGDAVCYEGYIMDIFCSTVGFLPHSTNRALHVPHIHTVKCLVDDDPCRESGFELLKYDPWSDMASPYCRAYKFDAAGNEQVLEVAKTIGSCTGCYENSTEEYTDGFRLTIRGFIADTGVEGLTPATMNVTSVQPSTVGGCGVDGTVEPEICVFENPSLEDADSPCFSPGDWCKNLGETKPETDKGLEITTSNEGAKVGDAVCYEGYVMDIFCSTVGFLPHSTNRALHVPHIHTVKCLVDDDPCRESGFELLKHDPWSAMASPYCRAYKFDAAGNEQVLEVAKMIGSCTGCYENSTKQYIDGFRLTIRGFIVETGVEGLTPATMNITSVQPSTVEGCGGDGVVEPEICVFENPSLVDADSPCFSPGDWCKNLGETKPELNEELENTTSSGAKVSLLSIIALAFAGLVVHT